jgi:nucleotide-binding universal stress UspA family protein
MRVLLASDGSSDSRRATRWLREFAPTVDITVTVLTVATLREPPRDAQTMRQLRESVVAEAREVAERAARILRRRWPEVETLITEGDPQVEIVRAAEERRVDMLVLGARGLGRLKRLLGGSTSLAAARYAPCPVAIIRGRPRSVQRALVCVDGSDGSRAALRFLSLFELARNARVCLLHVLQGPTVSGRNGSIASLSDLTAADERRKQRAEAERILTDATAVLKEVRDPVERLITDGDPARQIVSVANSHNVDLVVLGARGLRMVGRLLLGSVSETVLHHVSRPVVIVREGLQ